jgi:hypothetical protein
VSLPPVVVEDHDSPRLEARPERLGGRNLRHGVVHVQGQKRDPVAADCWKRVRDASPHQFDIPMRGKGAFYCLEGVAVLVLEHAMSLLFFR